MVGSHLESRRDTRIAFLDKKKFRKFSGRGNSVGEKITVFEKKKPETNVK